VRNLIKKILNENNEFDWVDDAVSNLFIGKYVNIRGKHFFNTYQQRFKDNPETRFPKGKIKWSVWPNTGCHKIVGEGTVFGEECFMIHYDNNNTLWVKKSEIQPKDIRIKKDHICYRLNKKTQYTENIINKSLNESFKDSNMKINDRVTILNDHDASGIAGKNGTVIDIDIDEYGENRDKNRNPYLILVKVDDWDKGHNGLEISKCGVKSCWWVEYENLRPFVDYEQTNSMFDKLYEQYSEKHDLTIDDLLCYRDDPYNKASDFTKNKCYPIEYIDYNQNSLGIINDAGYKTTWSIYKEPTYNYENWFYVMPLDIQDTDFFGQLYEQEDNFDWVQSLIDDVPNLPSPDGKQYLITFNQFMEPEKVKKLIGFLYSMGWYFGGSNIQYNVDIISNYTKTKDCYISLKPNKSMSFGYGKTTFEEYSDPKSKWDSTPKYYVN